jgi:hypothetical protein
MQVGRVLLRIEDVQDVEGDEEDTTGGIQVYIIRVVF